ncbi:MAG: Uma2 family endonuclease [Planctomycetota bacterium]
MTIRFTASGRPAGIGLPFREGDELDQPTFHRLYEAVEEDVKAELIEGVVCMPAAALRARHGDLHMMLMTWLGLYQAATPGVRSFDNATVILGPASEPQPDACVLREGGPAAVNDDDYIEGPPTLVVEVSHSSADRDLGSKQRDYERGGVEEYLVLIVESSETRWFVRGAGGRFAQLARPDDGVLRSPGLAGLWLDVAALFDGDLPRLIATLQRGIDGRHA